MELNADFARRAVVHAAELPWTPSPMPGVERRMLDRVGGEVARATSIVRYAPGSAFPAHVHELGEEYLVLEGTFQDEHGDFPAGSYVRNPPGSRHVPASSGGCTILVKLRQFDPDDRTAVHVDTASARWTAVPGAPGVEAIGLHADAREDVRLERWAPGAVRGLDAGGGLELLVLGGALEQGGDALRELGWLRQPAGTDASAVATAGPDGATVWVKRGHLRGGNGAVGG